MSSIMQILPVSKCCAIRDELCILNTQLSYPYMYTSFSCSLCLILRVKYFCHPARHSTGQEDSTRQCCMFCSHTIHIWHYCTGIHVHATIFNVVHQHIMNTKYRIYLQVNTVRCAICLLEFSDIYSCKSQTRDNALLCRCVESKYRFVIRKMHFK